MAAPRYIREYVQPVALGKYPACNLVRQQCIESLALHADPGGEWEFDSDECFRALEFIEGLPHVKGPSTRQLIVLENWQAYVVGEMFGWKRSDGSRGYVEVLLEVARKQGKSTLLAGVGNYVLFSDKTGPEIYSVATKRDQAKLVWAIASAQIRLAGLPDARLLQNRIVVDNDGVDGTFEPVSREADTLDGLNPSMIIVDEASQIKDRRVYEVMETATGARPDALTVSITTASNDDQTHYARTRHQAVQRLEKPSAEAARESGVFSLFYGLDAGDNWRDPATWIKANPNLGVSVREEYLARQVKRADADPEKRAAILTKHFNSWGESTEQWIAAKEIKVCAVDDLERTGKFYLAVDLANTLDLCALGALWVQSDGVMEFEHWTWAPEASLPKLTPKSRAAYDRAVRLSGELELVSEPAVDYSRIQARIDELQEAHGKPELIGVDGWNATFFTQSLTEKGYNVLEVGQSMRKLSSPAKSVRAAIAAGKFRHLGGPFLAWQFANAMKYEDPNGNIKIRKGTDKSRKVDSISALITAAACAEGQVRPENQPSRFAVARIRRSA